MGRAAAALDGGLQAHQEGPGAPVAHQADEVAGGGVAHELQGQGERLAVRGLGVISHHLQAEHAQDLGVLLAGLLGVDPGAHGRGGKGRGLFAGEADEGPGPGRRQVPGQAGHLQEHGHPAGVVVGPGGAGHGVEVGPQDVVAAGVLVPGDDIAHLLLQVAKGSGAGGHSPWPRKFCKDVILGGLEILGAVDGAVPQGDAQVVQVLGRDWPGFRRDP